MTKFLLLLLAVYFFYKYVTKPMYIAPPNNPERSGVKDVDKKEGDYIDYEEVK